MCSESGHVDSTQCHIERDICQLGWDVEGDIVQSFPSTSHGCHVQYVIYYLISSGLSAPFRVYLRAIDPVDGVVNVRFVVREYL